MFKIIVILFSVVLHEVAHGAVANSLGDPTAKNLGRLTLNPLKHLSFFGSILLPTLTVLIGGFIFGYAKPVPYNPANLRDSRYGPAKVAFSGPAVNVVIAVLFGLILRFLPSGLGATLLPELFAFVVILNIVLAIFNLMPIPPLDGHWLLLTFLPARFTSLKLFILRYNLIIFIFFILFVFPLLMPLINFLFRVIVG
ncbi:MAG: site-2 protease family protein [Candidatus Yanofskybacteria bacterium]|nr:site-2 protease family protein [Candidatus Yanofskybacteria bacterium]